MPVRDAPSLVIASLRHAMKDVTIQKRKRECWNGLGAVWLIPVFECIL